MRVAGSFPTRMQPVSTSVAMNTMNRLAVEEFCRSRCNFQRRLSLQPIRKTETPQPAHLLRCRNIGSDRRIQRPKNTAAEAITRTDVVTRTSRPNRTDCANFPNFSPEKSKLRKPLFKSSSVQAAVHSTGTPGVQTAKFSRRCDCVVLLRQRPDCTKVRRTAR